MSVLIERWRATFAFTGSFQAVWNGIVQSSAAGFFSILAPNNDPLLEPGETAIVGATGTFGTQPTPPSGFTFSAGDFSRPLATPQPPCLGVTCPITCLNGGFGPAVVRSGGRH